jgi:hypothetical protein
MMVFLQILLKLNRFNSARQASGKKQYPGLKCPLSARFAILRG